MLSTKPVLPNFLKALLTASLVFSSAAAFAGDKADAEKIGDLKDMKAKHSQKAEKMAKKEDAEGLASSMTDETVDSMTKGKADAMSEKVEEIKPGE